MRISAIRFPTNVFKTLGLVRIQAYTMEESGQRFIPLRWTERALTKVCASLEESKAAQSSSRGILKISRGATLDLLHKRLTLTSLFELTDLR